MLTVHKDRRNKVDKMRSYLKADKHKDDIFLLCPHDQIKQIKKHIKYLNKK